MLAVLKSELQEKASSHKEVRTSYDIQARRTVLVVGGVDGVGPAICKKLADMGHFVAATYHNEEQARVWQDMMEQEGYLFFIYKYDAISSEESRSLVNDIIADLGPVQILINADINSANNVSDITQAAIEGMLATGFGRIVNISSVKEKNKGCGQISHQGIRKSVHGLTKALARKVASRGITVNTVSSGYVATDMIVSMPESECGNIEAQIPVGTGKPENVAHIVSFLVSEESGFITGANIAAGRGYLMK